MPPMDEEQPRSPAELILVQRALAAGRSDYLAYKALDSNQRLDTLAAYYHFHDQETAEHFYEMQRIRVPLEATARAVEADPNETWSEAALAATSSWHSYRKLLTRYESALLDKLRSGELFAYGLDERQSLDEPVRFIDLARWETLSLDVHSSMASQPGLVITSIRVGRQLNTDDRTAVASQWLRKFIIDFERAHKRRTPSQVACIKALVARFRDDCVPRTVIRALYKDFRPEGALRGRRYDSKSSPDDTNDGNDGKM